MILTLARGGYCPKEHQQHLDLAAFYPKIAVAYTKVATITPDRPRATQEFHDAVGAQWPFLSDPHRTVQKDLGIEEYTDAADNPMIPHTLVLSPGWSSTRATTATGSGAVRRPLSSGRISERSRGTFGPIGT